MLSSKRFASIITKAATIAVAGTFLSPTGSIAGAQSAPTSRPHWEFLVSSGKLIPTGAQRTTFETGNHTAAQLAYTISPSVAITSSLGWARSHDVDAADAPHLNVFMLDLGSEVRAPRQSGDSGRFMVSPFAGAGVGARSYHARSVAGSAQRNVAAYVSAGSEIGVRRVRVRLEARDYLSGFRAFDGRGSTVARNDVVILAGLRIVKP